MSSLFDQALIINARLWGQTALGWEIQEDAPTIRAIADPITDLPPAAVAAIREVLEAQPPELVITVFLVSWTATTSRPACYVVILQTQLSQQGFPYHGDASQPYAQVSA